MKRNSGDGDDLLIGPRRKVCPWTWVMAILAIAVIWSWMPGAWTSPALRYNKVNTPPIGVDAKAPAVKSAPR